MIDHQPEAEKTIWKKHICFRESHRFQWPFQWVSPGHKGAMFVDFMGHLQQIMAILNLENPPAWYSVYGRFSKLEDQRVGFPTKTATFILSPMFGSGTCYILPKMQGTATNVRKFMGCVAKLRFRRHIASTPWLCLKIGNTEKLPLYKRNKKKQKRMEWNGFPILREPHRNTSLLAGDMTQFCWHRAPQVFILSPFGQLCWGLVCYRSFLASCFTKLIFVLFEDHSPNSSSWCQPFDDLHLLPNTWCPVKSARKKHPDPADGPLRSSQKESDQWPVGTFFCDGKIQVETASFWWLWWLNGG